MVPRKMEEISMKKIFRTYLPFVANEVKTQLAYRGAFYLWAFISLFSSFISYFLWMAGQLLGLEEQRRRCNAELEKLNAGKEDRLRSYQTLGLCAGAALVILFI